MIFRQRACYKKQDLKIKSFPGVSWGDASDRHPPVRLIDLCVNGNIFVEMCWPRRGGTVRISCGAV